MSCEGGRGAGIGTLSRETPAIERYCRRDREMGGTEIDGESIFFDSERCECGERDMICGTHRHPRCVINNWKGQGGLAAE